MNPSPKRRTTDHGMECTIRWAAWFGDIDLELSLPKSWDVRLYCPADGPDVGKAGIAAAFEAPIETARIRELARGRKSPCIVVDDLSRPTPGHRLVPVILDELAKAGIDAEDVLILGGVANHRPMTRDDFVKKVGSDAVARCRVRNHFSWEHCEHVGVTSHGTPVSVNADFLAADLKILVGSIVPHPVAGFAGGGKLVVPGVASIETAKSFHGPAGPATGHDTFPNPARLDVEEAARMTGVDVIVNAIPNSRREIAGLVVGDVVAAHRAGVEIATRVFATPTPTEVDIAVLSAYPKDTEYLQYPLAYNVWQTAHRPIAHDDATVVVATAASEGAGFHTLTGAGYRTPAVADPHKAVAPRDLVVFSPGVNPMELPSGHHVHASDRWDDVRRRLKAKHGKAASVAVFPCAAMQVASG
jgi:nickel-dependent lactate racemase